MRRLFPFTRNLLVCAVLLITTTHASSAATNQDPQILHLLNRVTFGPTAEDMEFIREHGSEVYLEQQLHPETLPTPPLLLQRLNQLSTVDASVAELAAQFQPSMDEGKLSPDEKRDLKKRLKIIHFELSEAKILRGIVSPAQLQEVMTDFWFNHFNVFVEKGLDRVLISSYERDAIRPYALGKFGDLLKATAHHPAMLFYLDNWKNTDPNSPFARKAEMKRGKEFGINENYAREIMELHTLGVNGGYTQQDVTTLAHILTGWGLGRGKDWSDKASFYFDGQKHDYNSQVFLGRTIQGGGEDEVDQVLDLLATAPATAHHIAYQLAQYFVADEPPETLVTKLTGVFQQTNGDIAAMLKTLFHSPEFWDPKYVQTKFKPPFRYVISAFRASGIAPDGDTRIIQEAIANMGEPLYHCLTPNGYANTNDQWLNSDALLKRVNVAKTMAKAMDAKAGSSILAALGNSWSASTMKAAESEGNRMEPALLLSSPEFLYY